MRVSTGHLLRILALCVTALLLTDISCSQTPQRTYTRSIRAQSNEVVVEEPPKPVIIGEKAADDLTDDEMIDFLQTKIQEVDQTDGQVRILRVAPGYPLTLLFNQSYQDVIVGDKGMVDVAKTPRGMVISATARKGDTSMQVMFSGGRRLVYHIIIAENFKEGMTSIRINFLRKTAASSGIMARDGGLNVRYIATVISNYDALKQEKAIDAQAIKRFPVFRKSKVTPFTYYDIFRFQDGTIAITFALENRLDQPVRINESKLRVVLGNMEFIPDYTSINHLRLDPGQKTTGFVIIAKTPFTINQPFELNWR
jgi:hypothetical protein